MSSTAAAHATRATSHTATATRQLTRIGAVLIVTGLAFVILALDAPAVLAWLYDLLASPGTTTSMDAGVRFGAALFGALTFGWGATLLQLGRGRSPLRAARDGTLAWFVVDSLASVLVGYGFNVLLNVAFAGLILVMLRMAGREDA